MFGLPRLSRIPLAALPLAALFGWAGCTCGSGPYQGDYFDGDRPQSLQATKFLQSEKGDPKIIGCADGQREGFADLKKNPRVAGCVGTWKDSKSLRDKPTGKPCGDDGAACAVPADLCSEGWHICGVDGSGEGIKTRTTQKDCDNAGPGRFNAAVSHSPNDELDPCPRITKSTKLPCVQAGIGAEPVCCGNDCLYGKCKDGVFKGKTRISRGTTEGCGAVTSDRNGGVMCCFDGDGNPEGGAPAGGDAKAEGGDAKAEGGDAKAEGGDAKAEGGDAKAEGGDAKAEGGDAKAEGGSADEKGKAEAATKGERKGAKKGGDTKTGADAKKDGEGKTAKGG